MRISLTPLDRLFSKYIKLRDKWCQRCGGTGGQTAHFHSRRYKMIRWDDDNACLCCFGCHQYLDSHPYEKIAFFEKRLEDKLELLNSRAYQKGKPDIEAITIYLKNKIKELESEYRE